MRRVAGSFGSKAILRKYARRGRAKAAAEDALVGVAALLSVPAGILDGSIKGGLGALRPMVVCGAGEGSGTLSLFYWRPSAQASRMVSSCTKQPWQAFSGDTSKNNKPVSRSGFLDANNRQNL